MFLSKILHSYSVIVIPNIYIMYLKCRIILNMHSCSYNTINYAFTPFRSPDKNVQNTANTIINILRPCDIRMYVY